MKSASLKVLLTVETMFVIVTLVVLIVNIAQSKETELFREVSPDGNYVLYIREIGKPPLLGNDKLRITLYNEASKNLALYRASFMAYVWNEGSPAKFDVKWTEPGAFVTLRGSGQPTAYYILPYPSIVD